MANNVSYRTAIKSQDPAVGKSFVDTALKSFEQNSNYFLIKRIADVAFNQGYWTAVNDSVPMFEKAMKELRKSEFDKEKETVTK